MKKLYTKNNLILLLTTFFVGCSDAPNSYYQKKLRKHNEEIEKKGQYLQKNPLINDPYNPTFKEKHEYPHDRPNKNLSWQKK